MRRADTFAMCRVFGHAWSIAPDDASWSSRRVWRHRMVLRCDRCTMVRYDGLDSRGAVGSRRYDPPPGYSYPADQQPSRAELRLAMVRPPEDRPRRPQPAPPPASNGEHPAPRRRAGPRRAARA